MSDNKDWLDEILGEFDTDDFFSGRSAISEAKLAILTKLEEAIWAQPCEPDCSDIRHAYHQGQWDMEQRIRQNLGLQ